MPAHSRGIHRPSRLLVSVVLLLALVVPLLPVYVAPVMAQDPVDCWVTTTADSAGAGPAGSLRAHINSLSACTVIGFNIPEAQLDAVSDGYVIQLASALPTLNQTMTIQGPNSHDGKPIEVRGSGLLEPAPTIHFRVFTIGGSGNVELNRLIISHGKVTVTGGGGVLNGGILTIRESMVRDNVVEDPRGFPSNAVHGGGIYNMNNLTVVESTINNNSMKGNNILGGGIASIPTATSLTIESSTISNNSLEIMGSGGILSGGGIYIDMGPGRPASIISSTISGNSSPLFGGGVYKDGTGALSITASTISDNTSNLGTAVRHFSGTTTATASILDGTCAINDGNITGDFNLTTTGSDCPGTEAGDLALDDLADNGGPTWTHLPVFITDPEWISPAIDGIDCDDLTVTTDQH